MTDLSTRNFGLLIAFLIPGFVVCLGVALHSVRLSEWMSFTSTAPTIGGFLYSTMASVAAGMTVSAVRWLVIDQLHHRTGVVQPTLSFSSLPQSVAALDTLVEGHYRFYQHYANMQVALVVLWLAVVLDAGFEFRQLVALLGILSILFVASRHTLVRYYRRVDDLLGS